MIIIRAAVPDDLPGLTKVMAQSFNIKMNVLFGREPARTQRLLHAIYQGPVGRGYDGVIVAELEGRIVGGMVIEPMPWLNEDVKRLETAIQMELGAWRRLWNAVGFSVFTHGPEPGDAYLSDVCVDPEMRGRGIAQRMVAHAEEWARLRDRDAMTLWVAASNYPARHVYEKMGMRVIRTEFNFLSFLLYGILRWTYMKKVLE